MPPMPPSASGLPKAYAWRPGRRKVVPPVPAVPAFRFPQPDKPSYSFRVQRGAPRFPGYAEKRKRNMFCSQCGNELASHARFCARCGTPVSGASVSGVSWSESRGTHAGEPVLVLRPRFIGWVTVLAVLPLQLFLTVWGAGFCGGFGLFAVQALKLPVPPWFTFVLFGCLFFFGVPLVIYIARSKTYAQTEYRFFSDHLEYAEGFWTAENKTIQYNKITESTMRRGVIQKKYGLGTIYLAIPATGLQQGRAASGIRVRDIEQPEKVYEVVQQLVGNGTH